MSDYVDLEIQIGPRSDKGGGAQEGGDYPVTLRADGIPGGICHSTLSTRELPGNEFVGLESRLALQKAGKRLNDSFFASKQLRNDWQEIKQGNVKRRIRLLIDSGASELHVYPWEFLSDGSGENDPLSAQAETPFSRSVDAEGPWASPVSERSLRILFVVASPDGLADNKKIDAVREYEAFAALVKGLDVKSETLDAKCTLQDIETKLKEGFHVLHFMGHGSRVDEEPALVLTSEETRQKKSYTASEVTKALKNVLATDNGARNLRLVVLASCKGASQPTDDDRLKRSLAERLVEAGVSAIVAMQNTIGTAVARRFTKRFYRKLLNSYQIDLAVNEARSEMLADSGTAAVPILYQRLLNSTIMRGKRTEPRNQESFWDPLIKSLESDNCLPFLGPGAAEILLADKDEFARALATRCNFPACDKPDLADVARFMQQRHTPPVKEYIRTLHESLLKHLALTEEERKRWLDNPSQNPELQALLAKAYEEALDKRDVEIHGLLSRFPLSIYATTNADLLMEKALIKTGKQARDRIESPLWEKPPGHIFRPNVIDKHPSPAHPVVFHLNGYDGIQERSQALSEDDYLEHLRQLARDEVDTLPAQVTEALARKTMLLVGYRLSDWDLRLLLHGVLKPVVSARRREIKFGSVIVHSADGFEEPLAQESLERYFKEEFGLNIFWGTVHNFTTELHGRWGRAK